MSQKSKSALVLFQLSSRHFVFGILPSWEWKLHHCKMFLSSLICLQYWLNIEEVENNHVFLFSIILWTQITIGFSGLRYLEHSIPCIPAWAGASKHRSLHSCELWLGCETCNSLCCYWEGTARQRRLSAVWPPEAQEGTRPHLETATQGPVYHSGSPGC